VSAPDYDPKQVSLLDAQQLAAALEAGLAAITTAGDLQQLAAARTAHLGGSSHVALANREIGPLPPAAKGDAGKRVNDVRRALETALDERKAELERDRDARVLVE
jgi:phenylalanyl-tRNA synthetase alpha chain